MSGRTRLPELSDKEYYGTNAGQDPYLHRSIVDRIPWSEVQAMTRAEVSERIARVSALQHYLPGEKDLLLALEEAKTKEEEEEEEEKKKKRATMKEDEEAKTKEADEQQDRPTKRQRDSSPAAQSSSSK